MTSARRITANRTNGRKSRGPRTPAGKVCASRNALRHGLATITYGNPAFATEIEQMAMALCEGDSNPQLFEHALVIAESDLVLRCVRLQRVAVIERLRDSTAIAFAKGDNAIALAKARRRKTELALAELERMGVAFDGWDAVIPEHLMQEESGEPLEHVPLDTPAEERNEVDALREAMPDIDRLVRYERRAWSRRRRAIRAFMETKSWECDL